MAQSCRDSTAPEVVELGRGRGTVSEKCLGWASDRPWGFRTSKVLRRTPRCLAWCWRQDQGGGAGWDRWRSHSDSHLVQLCGRVGYAAARTGQRPGPALVEKATAQGRLSLPLRSQACSLTTQGVGKLPLVGQSPAPGSHEKPSPTRLFLFQPSEETLATSLVITGSTMDYIVPFFPLGSSERLGHSRIPRVKHKIWHPEDTQQMSSGGIKK